MTDLPTIPTAEDIEAAAQRIAPHVHRTPLFTCATLDQITGANIYFKCENFQKGGAFKARGAHNAILSLSEKELVNGVATHSSGNHAQAMALAAKNMGIKAFIVMPGNAKPVKKMAVTGYGAEVIECAPTLMSREQTLESVVQHTGAQFIPPYNNYRVIAGQATAGKELIEDAPQPLDAVFGPVGGGGLISGTALSARYWSPKTKVIGGEPTGADDAYRSLQKGELVPSEGPQTIADGLLTSLGEKTFGIMQQHLHRIITVPDEEIVAAMRLVWERMKIIIEPSSAVPLAALIKAKADFEGQKIGIILSGGNVDLKNLPF